MLNSAPVCIYAICAALSFMVPPVLMDRQDVIWPISRNFAEREQESEHADVDEELLDWTLPGEEQMPQLDDSKDEFQVAVDGSLYLSDGDVEDSLESWVDQEDDDAMLGKLEIKRGFNLGSTRTKKNQVLCRVVRTVHHHNEAGHEFFPRSYTSYTCHPVGLSSTEQVPMLPSITHQDTCYVLGSKCITIEKEQLFLKKHQNTNCWSHFVEAVGAGCKCLSRKF